MNTDDILARSFRDLELTVPDPHAEFAALTTRLDGLGRRRAYRGAVGGLAVAGIAAAVAVGATCLPNDHTARPGMAAAPRPSAHATAVQPALRQVAFNRRLVTTTGADGVVRPVITIGAGWLPAGAELEQVGAGIDRNDLGDKRWVVPYADGPGTYYTGIEIADGTSLPEHYFGARDVHDLTVQGHPARMFVGFLDSKAVNQVTISVDLGDGQVAEANTFFETDELTTAEATAVTRHLARGMTYDQHETIPVTARLTAAPAGATIVSSYAGFGDYPMTYYRLDDLTTGAEIGIGNFAEKYPVTKGEPGRDVQGRPTVVIHDAQGRTGLYIKGLDGLFTKLYTGAGAETLDDLYLIADGIRAVR